jgi:tRNA/rRNA methyltransferase
MSGLSNAELDCCQMLAMIPANPEYSSLNLAAAVQVVCYELRMAILEGKLGFEASTELATNEAVEGFYRHLEDTLLTIGYLNPSAPKKLMERIRRIYARARLEKEEVNLLRGILTLSVTPKKHTKY